MSKRLIEFYTSYDVSYGDLGLDKFDPACLWTTKTDDNRTHVRVLVEYDETEALVDHVVSCIGQDKAFRLVILPVDASLPRDPEEEKDKSSEKKAEKKSPQRISREELYALLTKDFGLNRGYILLVILSAVVASIGLMRDNPAIIVGAMVMAPLLKPNITLTLATTLGDISLLKRSLKVNVVGVVLALICAGLTGVLLDFNPDLNEFQSRTSVGWGDIVLALASGVAGALTVTSGAPMALIGVMVAVALMPPLVTSGMLLGIGRFDSAFGALLLVATNVVCVNLAGTATFLLQKISPARYWEQERARKATRAALTSFAVLLVSIVVLILVLRTRT